MKENLQKVFFVFLLMFAFCITKVSAISGPKLDTAKKFKATLLDENQAPLKMVSVRSVKAKTKALSDGDGIFSIVASKDDELIFSLNKLDFFTYKIDSRDSVTIVINSNNTVLKQQRDVRMLFGTTANASRTATSTDVVYGSSVSELPVTGLGTALSGRLAGLYAFQGSGQPGADGSSLSLRGRGPLLIIDGVPRGFAGINLEEVESVTLLKDALSTAMLGAKGFNGVVLVTTKRGSKAKQSISFTAQTAFQQSLKEPKALNSFNYATLYNEAAKNDGLNQIYTSADLAAYKDGSDPFGHPDVDWRKQILKSNTRLDQYSLNVSGGNDFGKYFVALQHINQNGFFKTSDVNNYDTNNKFQTYVIRSNVDLQINPKLSASINLLGRILNGNGPGISITNFGSSTGLILNSLINTPNNAYPVYNPNGSFGTSPNYQTNIYGQAVNSGYTSNYKRDVLVDLALKRTLDEITPGLWARVAASLYSTLSEDNVRSKSFASFAYNPLTQVYTQYGNNGTQSNTNGIAYQGRSDYMEFKLGYDRSFGLNNINALLLANRDNSTSGSDLPYTIKGISGRAAYNYNDKYTAEVAFAYNGANYFPPAGDFKYEFFPAVGLSWNISNEEFLKDNKLLSSLKLFSSYGKNGNDNSGYFSYIQRYFDGTSAFFGASAGSQTSIFEQPLANPNLGYEVAKKLNVGVNGTLFKNKLGFRAEYYLNKYADLIMQRGRNTAILGQTYPNENIGQYDYKGWDFSLNWSQNVKPDFSYFISANASIQDSKVVFIDEVTQPYEWMRATGNRVGQGFGYIAEGLFQSQSEINSSAKLDGYTAQPGDIKYRDLNGDNIINQFDQTAISQNKPLIFFGTNVGVQFKSFDISVLIQGAVNRQIYLAGNAEWAFQNNGLGQAWEHNLNRWTPATAATATYPRLGIGSNINNDAYSTYWMHSGNFVRLKNVELGYTLPQNLTKKVGLQSTRFFVTGTNLFTLSSFDRVDPEVYSGAYPIQRLFNLGINIKL
jgi:TonB-linked SusC/RagA family outer membrane protein